MPVKIRKKDGEYSVSTPGGVKAKGTTLAKAKAQERLLNAVEHSDWRPTGRKSSRSPDMPPAKGGGVTCAVCGGKHKTVSHAGMMKDGY